MAGLAMRFTVRWMLRDHFVQHDVFIAIFPLNGYFFLRTCDCPTGWLVAGWVAINPI